MAEEKQNSYESIDQSIVRLETRLGTIDAERAELIRQLQTLRYEKGSATTPTPSLTHIPITGKSSPELKLALFRRLFRGREDIYARRWEDMKTGKSGYHPACRFEWPPGAIDKSQTKRIFLPLNDEVLRCHLRGEDPSERHRYRTLRDFTIGIYPLLLDETCWFLAVDFDKATWQQDALAYIETCRIYDVPEALERSRSGNGGHIWIFFQEAVPAVLARKLGSFLLTKTMERRPEIGLESYDRFFPNQDTMPTGGFGNLIALPLQKLPREQGNSVFVDDQFTQYSDQLAFLSSLHSMPKQRAVEIVEEAQRSGQILGVRMVLTDEDEEPWEAPPSRRSPDIVITDPLPKQITITLGNQLYVPRNELPPALVNQLVRLAAFQNPEFYKAQAMRFSTFDKPRIIGCAESFIKHIGLPRGCLDEVLSLLDSLKLSVELQDQRVIGNQINAPFNGTLRTEQKLAAESLLKHDIGVLAATTAFGKTVVAAYLLATRGVNTLILVYRRQLLDQWRERLAEFLEVDRKQIGTIGSGKRRATGVIDIALVQSLCRKGVVNDIVGQYGHLIVDECHHLSAVSFEQIARACKARYVVGLSATTIRKDGRHPIIFMQCGPIRYQADARDQASKRPFDHRVIVRTTGFCPPADFNTDEPGAIQRLYAALLQDDARNDLIVSDVMAAIRSRRSPVVLTERMEHLELLAERLHPICRNVIVLRGGMGTKKRRAITEEIISLPENEERVLIGTGRYIGEGFDDARLDTLFLAMPISWRGTLAQYAGRLHRLYDRKTEVRIYDYADLGHPMLAKMHERRLRGYHVLGYRIDNDMERNEQLLRVVLPPSRCYN